MLRPFILRRESLSKMNGNLYIEVLERISVKRQTWERSFDGGKTWAPVDWSAYPFFPFAHVEVGNMLLAVDPKAEWTERHLLSPEKFKQLYPERSQDEHRDGGV